MRQEDGSWAYVQTSKTGDAPINLGPSPGPTQKYMAPVTKKQPDGTYAYVQYPENGGLPINRGPAPSPGEEEAEKKTAERNSEILSFKPQATAAIIRSENKASIVIDAGEKALEIIRRNPKNITGITGTALKLKPGSDAYQLAQYLKTMRSHVGFNELQAMKQDSQAIHQ